VRLEASTKPHVHRKFKIFWTNIASIMAYPNFKNGPKKVLRCLGVNLQIQFLCKLIFIFPYLNKYHSLILFWNRTCNIFIKNHLSRSHIYPILFIDTFFAICYEQLKSLLMKIHGNWPFFTQISTTALYYLRIRYALFL
jgi:hypothetical protein